MSVGRIEPIMPIQTINRRKGGKDDALYARASVVKTYRNATVKFLAAMLSNNPRKSDYCRCCCDAQ